MKLKALVLVGVMLISAVFVGGRAYADVKCPNGSLREGDMVSTLALCNLPDDSGEPTLMQRVQQIINVVVGVLGVVAVAVIIVGAVYYVTSQGEAAKIARAKNTILYGIIGLIVAGLAFAIVNFVLTSVFGGTTTPASGSTTGTTGSVIVTGIDK